MYLPRLLLAIFVFGLVGVGAELLLIEHVEGVEQIIPLALIIAGLVTCAWHARAPRGVAPRAFRLVLIVMAASGVLGQYLHLRGNMEFEIERDPTLGRWPLLRESLMGATPALAPGTMVLLALIGYAYMLSVGPAAAPHKATR